MKTIQEPAKRNLLEKLKEMISSKEKQTTFFNVRETKSEDYMVVAEIEDNTFKSFKATQTFHFLDIVFL
ncbi:MAG: hypothetical protein H6573_22750 [Lewinellaceae bacterium]|nr:hypothetical protein [Lewinellaceae bacterium]